MCSLQIEGVAPAVNSLTANNQQHIDAELVKILKELEAKVANMREKLSKVTMEIGRHLMEVDLPKWAGKETELSSKAQARMQEVIKATIPQN